MGKMAELLPEGNEGDTKPAHFVSVKCADLPEHKLP